MKLQETLLVSDLDGTLVDANGDVPPDNNAAIRRYQAQGGHFAVATGRSWQSAGQYFVEWKPDAPCILLNGSVLYDYTKHKPVQVTAMPAQSIASFLAALLEQMPDAGAEVFNPDAVGVLRFEVNIHNHLTPEVFLSEHGLPDFPKPWCKALISCAAGRMAVLRELAERLPHAGLRLVNSSANYLEILPEGVSKGSGLRAHRRIYLRDKGLCRTVRVPAERSGTGAGGWRQPGDPSFVLSGIFPGAHSGGRRFEGGHLCGKYL